MAGTSNKLLLFFFILVAVSACTPSWIEAEKAIDAIVLKKETAKYVSDPQRYVEGAKAKRYGEVTVVDFRSPTLCGTVGCLYLLFAQEKATPLYLQPIKSGLFTQDGNCLLIRQIEDRGARQNRFCPTDSGVAILESKLQSK